MAVGFPTKANWAAGDVLTASALDDLAGTVNLLNPTAKGNLISASAANTPALLTVGADGQTLVADSSTSTGLRYQGSTAAGRNFTINGGFDIWQRNTSVAGGSSSSTFTADRWVAYRAVAGSTFSRQTTSDTTNLPTIQYCVRVARDSGNTSTSGIILDTSFETVNSIPLAGQTVTLSFYARSGANFSPSAFQVQLRSGTGTDQNDLSGFTGVAGVAASNPTLTTTWTRYSVTGTVAAGATQLAVRSTYNPTGTAGANDYYEITGVQVELGSVATTFTRTGGTIQGELAACQRYYFATQTGTSSYIGYAYATNGTIYDVPFPVSMRTNPTNVITSGTCSAYALNASTAITPTFDKASVNSAQILGSITITAGQGSRIECGANNIGFSAEL